MAGARGAARRKLVSRRFADAIAPVGPAACHGFRGGAAARAARRPRHRRAAAPAVGAQPPVLRHARRHGASSRPAADGGPARRAPLRAGGRHLDDRSRRPPRGDARSPGYAPLTCAASCPTASRCACGSIGRPRSSPSTISQAGLFYVAANGRIFAAVGTTDGRDLPYISGLRQADLDGRPDSGPAQCTARSGCSVWSGASRTASARSPRFTPTTTAA